MTQPSEDEEFLQGLHNEDPKVRWRTALKLSSWADSRSADLLKTALAADASPKVRAVAALSLGHRGAGGRETGICEPLVRALSDEDREVRAAAAKWLGRLKDSRAVEPLMTALADKHSEVRESAVRSLRALGDARAVQTLLDALSDQNEFVRDEANQALIELGDPEPEMRLSTAISSNSPDVRLAAALDLANRHDRRALAPLAAVLTRSWDGMKDAYQARMSAIEGLLKFRDADAVPALLFAVGDDDFEVKVAANQALIELGDPQPFERLSKVIEFFHIDEKAELRRAYDRSEYHDQEATAQSKRWIAEDRELRCEAIKALGKLGDPRGIRLLLEALYSWNEEMQKAANQALIDLGDPEPYDRLARLIQYPRWQLGRSAFAQLADRGGEPAIEILSRALTNDYPEVKLQAASALITLSDAPKFDALMILLSEGEKWQREKAAKALGALGDLRAVRPLLDALRDDDTDVRDTASTALMDLGDPEPEKHRLALREKEHDDAIEVLEDWKAAGELKSIHAVNELRSRAKAFLHRTELEISDLAQAHSILDDVPVFIEYQAGSELFAYTWTGFVLETIDRYLEGGSWDDLEWKNNFALYLMGLEGAIDAASGATQAYLQECHDILDGIWDEVYGD